MPCRAGRRANRRLARRAAAIPAHGTFQILQGTVDYAGAQGLAANTKVIGSDTPADLTGGSVTKQIDTGKNSFLRTQVFDSSGTLIGLSNPAWLLRKAPPGGIPAPRRA